MKKYIGIANIVRFSRNISKYNLRQLTCVFHFRCNVVTGPLVEGYPGIVISWKYYTERLFDSSCVNHDSTQPQFPIYMCHPRCIRNNDRPDVALFGENTKVCQCGGGGGAGKSIRYQIFPTSPLFLAPPDISPLYTIRLALCSAYKSRSPFARTCIVTNGNLALIYNVDSTRIHRVSWKNFSSIYIYIGNTILTTIVCEIKSLIIIPLIFSAASSRYDR